MIIDQCEECSGPLDDLDTEGLCSECKLKIEKDNKEANKDREFDEKCSLGYL